MFSSPLAVEMTSYIELRASNLCPSQLAAARRTLLHLDQYLVTRNFQGKVLTEDILEAWISTLTGKSKTIKEKIGAVRCFVRYLNSLGHNSYLPGLPKVKSDYIPYIFSEQEVTLIFRLADNLLVQNPEQCSPFLHLKVPMALRVLYGCGTRLEETMSLQRQDIDFQNGTLFLRNTKYSKERMIPVHESLLSILERYCLALGIMDRPDAFVFPGKKAGTHYTGRQLHHWFSRILQLADIDQRPRHPNERGACLHCFRHLFVLKSMQQMEAAGHSVDIHDLLLPTYLGHECLLDTDKYMRFSGAQVPESLKAFETYTSGLIPTVEVPYEEE